MALAPRFHALTPFAHEPICEDSLALYIDGFISGENRLGIVAGDPISGFLSASVEPHPYLPKVLISQERTWFSEACVGIALLKRWIAWSVAHGAVPALSTMTATASPRAGRALRRLGFREVETAWVWEG